MWCKYLPINIVTSIPQSTNPTPSQKQSSVVTMFVNLTIQGGMASQHCSWWCPAVFEVCAQITKLQLPPGGKGVESGNGCGGHKHVYNHRWVGAAHLVFLNSRDAMCHEICQAFASTKTKWYNWPLKLFTSWYDDNDKCWSHFLPVISYNVKPYW